VWSATAGGAGVKPGERYGRGKTSELSGRKCNQM
jgi:hypothetical protein